MIDQSMKVRRLSQFSPVPKAQRQVPLPHISSWVHAGKQSEIWVTNQGLFDQNTQQYYQQSNNIKTKYSIFHSFDQSLSSFQYHLWT